MLFRRRKAAPAEGAPRAAVALALKRKGTLSTYLLEEDGSAKPARERVDADLTIMFDEDERRIVVPSRVSYHTAFRRFRQSTGLAMSVINASIQTGAIYGIEEGRAASFTGKTLPITYLVDLALKEDRTQFDDQPMLVAVFFGDMDKPNVPLLVIGVNPDREMVLHDLVPGVSNFQTTIINILGSMASGPNGLRLGYDPRQENRSEEVKKRNEAFFAERVLRIKADALIGLAARAKSYPREAIYRGFSQSTLGKVALGASVTGFALSVAFCGMATFLRKSAEEEAASVEARMAEKRHEVRSQLLDRINGLGARLSLDHEGLMSAADSLWRPGTKVTLSATLEGAALTLIAPNLRDQVAPGSDRRYTFAARGADSLLEDLRVTPPTGWTRTSLESSGDMHAWLVSFQSNPVERDLLDLVSGGIQQGAGAVAAVSDIAAQPRFGASAIGASRR